MALVTNINLLSLAISHATAPAFMLGAVAGFLAILVATLRRVADKIRALRSTDATAVDPSGALGASFSRRMLLLSRAIYFAGLRRFGDGGVPDWRASSRPLRALATPAWWRRCSPCIRVVDCRAGRVDARDSPVYMANMDLE